MNHRIRLITFGLAFLLPLALVAGLNTWKDPYARMTSKPVPLPRSNFKSLNLALFSAAELRKAPRAKLRDAQVILSGESRAYPLTGRRFSTDRNGRNVLNLSIPSGSQDEYLTFLDQHLPQLEKADLVVIIASLERFQQVPHANRSLQTEQVLKTPVHYLLNKKVLFDSVERLESSAPVTSSRVAAERNREPAVEDPRVRLTWESMEVNYNASLTESYLEKLRAMVEKLRARGLKVILWAPPLRNDMLQGMESYGFLPEWQRIAAELRTFAPLVDLTTQTALNGTPFTFNDPSHHNNGPLILEHLIAEGMK